MAYTTVRQVIASLLLKIEGTYGTDASPVATTDAFWLQFASSAPAALVGEALTYDGKLGDNSVGLQPLSYSAPTGRSATLSATMYPRGYGGAYSASHLPPNGLDVGMQAAGFGKTVVTSSGTESVTYAPLGDGTTPVSATAYGYGGQVLGGNVKLLKGLGMQASLKIDATDQKPALYTFDMKGIFGGNPTEAAYTAPTVTDSPAVPNSAGMTFSLGGVSLNLYSVSTDMKRDLSSARVPNTASGAHLGFVAGAWMPTSTVTVEQEAIATIDPWALRAAASTGAFICGWNQATQYNRHKILGPQTQVIDVKESLKGKIKCWDLTLLHRPSTPTGNDSISIVFD